jgi:hypothetical protein
MAHITITLIDTPDGVAIKHDWRPRIGEKLTPAQAWSLEMVSKTHAISKTAYVPDSSGAEVTHLNAMRGIDMDAVYSTHNNTASAA